MTARAPVRARARRGRTRGGARGGSRAARRQRVAAEQALDEGHVAEVAHERGVAGEQQLLGIEPAEAAGVHLPLEVPDRPLEAAAAARRRGRRPAGSWRRAPRGARCGRTPGSPEEPEAGGDHPVDLAPALARVVTLGGDLDPTDPLDEGRVEDLLVDRLLRREVVQDARAADARPPRRCRSGRCRRSPARRSGAVPRAGSLRASCVTCVGWPRRQGTDRRGPGGPTLRRACAPIEGREVSGRVRPWTSSPPCSSRASTCARCRARRPAST